MNRQLHSTSSRSSADRTGALSSTELVLRRTEARGGVALPLLRAVCGITMLGMLILPGPADAAVMYKDGSNGFAFDEFGGSEGEPGSLGHGTGLSTNPGDAPFGDDTIGTLPIHCDDDDLAMDEIMASLAPVFFVEGSSSDILHMITGAAEAPGAVESAAVYAIPGSTPGNWRVYFLGDIDLTLDRGFVADSKHRIKYGLFGSQGFGRGRVAYGGPGSGWSRPAALYALSEHRIPLAELERNGLLVGPPTKIMTLSATRRSTTVLQDTGAGLEISLRP